MSEHIRPKIPAAEKRPQRRTETARPDLSHTAGWLPDTSAGFSEWARVSDRAKEQFYSAVEAARARPGDRSLAAKAEAARQVWHTTIDRAYPAGFFEHLEELHRGDTTHVEIYIAFLEADPHFYRSGYSKTKAIQGLKRVELTKLQRNRLQDVITRVVDKGFRREFRDYCRLARHVQTEDWLRTLETRLTSYDASRALRAQWVIEASRRK